MADLKLAKLPDRTPIKIGILILPELNEALAAYADLYRETYGDKVSVPDLIPAMIDSFLANDRVFMSARKSAAQKA
jgi:hypothetical protein